MAFFLLVAYLGVRTRELDGVAGDSVSIWFCLGDEKEIGSEEQIRYRM